MTRIPIWFLGFTIGLVAAVLAIAVCFVILPLSFARAFYENWGELWA